MPKMPSPVKVTYVVHSLKPDGSCSCGDTGCDGPITTIVTVQSASTDRIPQVMPTSFSCSTSLTSASCRLPIDETKTTSKMTQQKTMMKEEKNNNKNNNNAAAAAGRYHLGAACKQRTLKIPRSDLRTTF